MKKLMPLTLAALAMLLSGCATEGYVRTQTDPLADRIGKMEAKLNDLQSKLGKAQGVELSPADKAALQEARDMAKKAADMAGKAEAEARQANGDARKAEAAAKTAEDAAKEAQKAAKKSEKIFRLEQKK